MARTLFTAKFWLDTLERAIKTLGQTGAAVLTAAGVGSQVSEVPTIDAKVGLIVIGAATVYSVFTSIASAPVGDVGTASLVPKD